MKITKGKQQIPNKIPRLNESFGQEAENSKGSVSAASKATFQSYEKVAPVEIRN